MNAFHESGVNTPHITLSATRNEDGAGFIAEPTNQWPITNIGFSNKAAGMNRVDNENIQPRNMVADDERGMRWLLLQRFIYLQGNAADANQLMRPALYATIAS
jgi:hypothetical protein